MLSDLITPNDGVQRVLVAPLNWGLGHATRMIPLIRYCLDLGKQVAIASDGIALNLLRREFPELESYSLPSYNIKYAKSFTGLKIVLQSPKIVRATRTELSVTAKIVEHYQPDLIISDNRFGVRHPTVKSVVVSHQVALISPIAILTPIARIINRKYLNRFDAVWIMDYPDRRLTGNLSNPKGLKNSQSLGVMTRLKPPNVSVTFQRELLVILSGPEPQRTLLEEKLFTVLRKLDFTFTIVRGCETPLTSIWSHEKEKGLIYDLVESDLLNQLINTSQLVITRTGYTSIMDLDVLQKPAILIPTPGQPEQEYLGRHLQQSPLFTILSQANVERDLEGLIKLKG